MKADFQEIVKQKTDRELELISKDFVFYSEEEQLVALKELESRGNLTKELLISKKDIEYSKEMEEENKKPTHIIRLKDLTPQKNYLFTQILIYANVIVFILMLLFGMNMISPSIDTLVKWGGNIRYLTINGQLWRLFTCIFLHGGILHLIFNMYALLYVGSVLEKVIGKNKYIFAYMVSGIAASISSLMIYENVVSVGASGAIFGLFGVLIPLLSFKRINFPNISVDKLLFNVSLFVLYNIVAGFNKSGIDNAAHIGGLFTGVIIGILYSMIVLKKIRPKLTYAILLLSLCLFSVVVITNVSNEYRDYFRAVQIKDYKKRININKNVILHYSKKIDESKSQKIAEIIKKSGFLEGSARADLFFDDELMYYSLKFVIPDTSNLSDPIVISEFNRLKKYINHNLNFDKQIEIFFTDSYLVNMFELPENEDLILQVYEPLLYLQTYQINNFHTIYYNLNTPIEDIRIVGVAINRLKGYFPDHQRIDIIFLNNCNNYSIKFFVSKNLWQEPAIVDRLKSTVDYIADSGIEKPINLVLIDNQTYEESQIMN